jgi:glutamate/tyrosine decarboxylase-like PLP-dependent enzyme
VTAGRRRAQLQDLLPRALALVADWEASFGPAPAHPALDINDARFESAWREFGERMAGNYPFFHPRYAGQMLKPPHPVAAAAYTAAMLVNTNNHALDGGPATSELEKEVVRDLAAMFRLPRETLGHLTASGTIANLEALWVARELAPGKAVVHGAGAHYTHARMCRLLSVPAIAAPMDAAGRLDLDAVDALCRRGDVGTVVLTPGSTGLGAVDRVDEALALRERHGVRLHADAAYGGFFALLAAEPDPLVPAAPLRALAECDSVVVDPHKHGLQPYGCGAVLFRDPDVGRLYKHDSPYTYFTSGELHLGEISLECSRAGAAAAALWLTLRALDLAPILAAGVRAAQAWAALIEDSDALRLHIAPELDILTFFPNAPSAAEIDAASARVLAAGMADDDPVFLSTLRVDLDGDPARILRSVLMKPEHEAHVPWLHERVSALAKAAIGDADPSAGSRRGGAPAATRRRSGDRRA